MRNSTESGTLHWGNLWWGKNGLRKRRDIEQKRPLFSGWRTEIKKKKSAQKRGGGKGTSKKGREWVLGEHWAKPNGLPKNLKAAEPWTTGEIG